MYVAPNRVSGRVVNTSISMSSCPTTGKTTDAPVLRPIQFRCIVLIDSVQSSVVEIGEQPIGVGGDAQLPLLERLAEHGEVPPVAATVGGDLLVRHHGAEPGTPVDRGVLEVGEPVRVDDLAASGRRPARTTPARRGSPPRPVLGCRPRARRPAHRSAAPGPRRCRTRSRRSAGRSTGSSGSTGRRWWTRCAGSRGRARASAAGGACWRRSLRSRRAGAARSRAHTARPGARRRRSRARGGRCARSSGGSGRTRRCRCTRAGARRGAPRRSGTGTCRARRASRGPASRRSPRRARPLGFGVQNVWCSSQKSCQRASISLARRAPYRNGGAESSGAALGVSVIADERSERPSRVRSGGADIVVVPTGLWLSPAEHLHGMEGVAGSNPARSTHRGFLPLPPHRMTSGSATGHS